MAKPDPNRNKNLFQPDEQPEMEVQDARADQPDRTAPVGLPRDAGGPVTPPRAGDEPAALTKGGGSGTPAGAPTRKPGAPAPADRPGVDVGGVGKPLTMPDPEANEEAEPVADDQDDDGQGLRRPEDESPESGGSDEPDDDSREPKRERGESKEKESGGKAGKSGEPGGAKPAGGMPAGGAGGEAGALAGEAGGAAETAATAAKVGRAAALLANPVTWIIIAVVLGFLLIAGSAMAFVSTSGIAGTKTGGGEGAQSAKDGGSGAGGAGGAVSGDVQSLAKQLLESPRVSFPLDSSSPNGSSEQVLKELAAGRLAPVHCTGGKTKVSPKMMRALVAASKEIDLPINALTDKCHSSGSNHYKGTAVDFNCGLNESRFAAIARKYGGQNNGETCASASHSHYDFPG